MTTTTPANDTASPLPVGRTVESSTWRAHRYAGHVEIVDLRNAGKRGKSCVELSLSGREEAVDTALPFVVDAVAAETSPEAFEASLVDLAIPGVTFTRRELKAISVPREPEIRIASDLVSGHCSQVDGVLAFTAIHGRPNGETFRQDTLTSPESRKDAAKLHAWLKETGDAVTTMSITAFRVAMHDRGIRVS